MNLILSKKVSINLDAILLNIDWNGGAVDRHVRGMGTLRDNPTPKTN